MEKVPRKPVVAVRFAAVLAAATAIAPAGALADGGTGGRGASTITVGGSGGTDANTAAGGAGGVGTIAAGTGGGGGGGGAGTTGGAGGDGTDVGAGTPLGGSGGATAGAAGANGTDYSLAGSGGAAGGGGGAHGAVLTTTTTSGGATGGAGGRGGHITNSSGGGGGGGGAGGYGVVVDGSGLSFTNTGTAAGGAGGAGGNALTVGTGGIGGNGGTGGIGVLFTAAGTLTNTGTISGGSGGGRGTGTSGNGSNAAGGVGVSGSGLTIVTSGGISGGLGGDGTTRANAISFTGGTNSLTLQTGASITGAIAVAGTLDLVATASNTTLSSGITGGGSLTKSGAGILTLGGTSNLGGGTTVSAGTLVVNSTLTSSVTVGSGGTLGGTGTIVGLVTNNGTIAPGNSIGTLNITGNYVQSAGSIYQVEVNAAGQSDKIVASGTATINGGTVQVVAQSGTYARNTTYTILTANGGRTGTYSNVTSNFAFLTPSLSYDANNVFLILQSSQNSFAAGAQTPNQFAVGTALDLAAPGATGDFATVVDALYGLNTVQGPAALNTISGQNYSSFSTGLVQTASLFMSNFSGQAGGTNRGSVRVALAEACTIACDTTEPGKWGVWGGAIGATGSIGGNSNAGTTTYNAGGFAAGLDRQITPELLLGVTVGYASGNQWVSGFSGRGWSGTVQTGLYASYTKGPIYFDALAGYAYSNNNMVRQIVIPGLNARSAQGSTGANQFFGQLEGGYRFDIGGAPQAYVTPFVRLQASTATQNAFTESGANSLNLNVAQQTTNSLRSVLGAQIGGSIDSFAAQLKLGWSHEFANTDRPVTAAFAGAPALPFTTYGATPNRDGVVLGFNATQSIGERSEIFVRYEGDISGSDNTHAGTVGVRFTW